MKSLTKDEMNNCPLTHTVASHFHHLYHLFYLRRPTLFSLVVTSLSPLKKNDLSSFFRDNRKSEEGVKRVKRVKRVRRRKFICLRMKVIMNEMQSRHILSS